MHDYSSSVAFESSVTVPLTDNATLHIVHYFRNGCLLNIKAFLVLSVELKQTAFIVA